MLMFVHTSNLQAQPGCSYFPADQLLQRFSHVFVGKILQEKEGSNYRTFSVKILENFKGSENQTLATVYKVPDVCQDNFSVGKIYLVVANQNEKGILGAWSFNNGFKNQREYIEILRWKKSAKKTGLIVGTVFFDDWQAGYPKPKNINKVYLRNQHGAITKTSIKSDGHYKFDNLTTGRYTIYLDLPKGIKLGFTKTPAFKDVNVSLGSRHLLNFGLTHDNSISGEVINSYNQPINSMCIVLFSIDKTGNETKITSTATDEKGKYEFNEIPPSKYVILAYPFIVKESYYNIKTPFDVDSEYAPSFFPSALSKSNAKIIDLKLGEKFTKANISLQDSAKREISGQVLNLDKTPAAEVDILFYVLKKMTDQFILRNDTNEVITKTDRNGFFSFRGLENTKYLINAVEPIKTVNSKRLMSECVELPSNGDVKLLKLDLGNRYIDCQYRDVDYSK
jgi:hypothetical protein